MIRVYARPSPAWIEILFFSLVVEEKSDTEVSSPVAKLSTTATVKVTKLETPEADDLTITPPTAASASESTTLAISASECTTAAASESTTTTAAAASESTATTVASESIAAASESAAAADGCESAADTAKGEKEEEWTEEEKKAFIARLKPYTPPLDSIPKQPVIITEVTANNQTVMFREYVGGLPTSKTDEKKAESDGGKDKQEWSEVYKERECSHTVLLVLLVLQNQYGQQHFREIAFNITVN